MKNKHFQHFRVATVGLLVLLPGCVAPVASTPTFASVTPLSVADTPTPGLTPPVHVSLPAPIPKSPTSKNATPSPTIASTPNADREQAMVLDLLQNNAGCQLPCWWGFTPGETSWQTAQAFFTSLGKIPDEFQSPSMLNYSVSFSSSQHGFQNDQIYIVKDGGIEAIGVRAEPARNHETVYGDKQFAKDWQRYFLPEILTAYGPPTQVLLRTFRSTPETFVPFNLLLFYPQQGLLVRYYGPTEETGGHIRICPQQADITLWTWPNDQKMTLNDIASWGILQFPVEEVPEFRPLEEATEMSVDKFYETFKNDNSKACLETPIDIWP